MYDYEQYYEPTLGDDIIREATEKLKSVIKDDFKNYYENILLENKCLQEENARLVKLENNLFHKETELKRKEENLERSFHKKKWSEILKDLSESYYQLCHEWGKQEKCNLCDDDRKITFTNPHGDTLKQNCKCSNNKCLYVPKAVKFINYLSVYKSNSYSHDAEMGYSIKFESRSDNDERWVEINAKKIRDCFETEKGNDTYDIVYKTLEECQKHCDYLNSR